MFSSKKGFTLIELLVSLAIFALILSFLVVGYNTFRTSRQLSLAAGELQTQLRLVRTKAIAGEKPSSGCDTLDGYRVEYVGGNIFYTALCNGGNPVGEQKQVVIKTEIDSIDAFDSFIFEALTGRANTPRSIVINYAGSSKTLNISRSGEITF